MPEKTTIYKVGTSDELQEVKAIKLNLEERIQTWVKKDVGIIADNLLVIGNEVETVYGGFIDILCIDGQGDIVVLELKRDKTPREVTAQTLDYASWVNDLSHDEITKIADDYYKEEDSLENHFSEKFGFDLPDTLNTDHKMIVIGSTIDASTERIIHYLSEEYGVGINAVTFTFHELDGQEFLSRNMVIEENEALAQHARSSRSKRQRNLTLEEFRDLMKEKDLLPLFDKVVERLSTVFNARNTTRSTVTFTHDFDGHMNAILALEPDNSSKEKGIQFYVSYLRIIELFGDIDDFPNRLFNIDLRHEVNTHYGHKEVYLGVIKDENSLNLLVKELTDRKKW